MPEELSPDVWWLIIGTNNLAQQQCSEKVVLRGILRLIEEIQEKKPNAKIVINGILTISTDEDGAVPDIYTTPNKSPMPKGGKKQR